MGGYAFLQDMAVVMLAAGLVSLVFNRLRQPALLGFILAGILIGPHLLPVPLVQNQETIHTLSELGILFLMFSLGLEFNLRKLRAVAGSVLVAAPVEILLVFTLGYHAGGWFGWPVIDRIFLGAMICISSTTLVVKILDELGRMRDRSSHLIFGILIVEDVLAITLMTVLSSIALTGNFQADRMLSTLGRLVIFVTVVIVCGLLLIPRLLNWVNRFRREEVLLITVLGLSFGVSLGAVRLGFSLALGAFAIGAVIAECRQGPRVATLVQPLRDMFSAVFFVAIGMMFEPRHLLENWKLALLIWAVLLVGKLAGCVLGVLLAGHSIRTAFRVGTGLAQIGEFSFIIASLGLSLGVTGQGLYSVAVSVSAVSAFTAPILMKNAERFADWSVARAPERLARGIKLYTEWVTQAAAARKNSLTHHLIRKWTWQISLNVILISAIFLAAGFLPAWSGDASFATTLRKMQSDGWLWLGAAILSLPGIIAIFRKLQALGLLLGDLSVKSARPKARNAGVRLFIAQLVPAVGIILLALFLLLLSSTFLPPRNVLWISLLLIPLLSWLLWRSLVKMHSRLQISLHETLTHAPFPEVHPVAIPAGMSGLIAAAHLHTARLTPQSPAAGKMIRELELRSRTGVTIVAIERKGTNIINPLPDEELQGEDRLLLLGLEEQMGPAMKFLTGEEPSSSGAVRITSP